MAKVVRKFNIQLFGGEGGDPKIFTQEEVDKIVADRLAREKKRFDNEKRDLERKHNESVEEYEERIKTANMTAEEKYKHELKKRDDLLAERDGTLKKIATDGLKKTALSKHKLPESFMSRIAGETEEEIEASVKEFGEGISEYLKAQAGGTPNHMGGGSSGKVDTDAGMDAFDKEFN